MILSSNMDVMQWLWNNRATEFVKYASLSSYEYICPKTATKQTLKTTANVFNPNMINIPASSRWFIRLAGLSGALAVALGAYGAHVFYQRDYPEKLKQVYETANRYHFIHSLALLGVPLCKRPMIAGSLITTGSLIFCGTCYYYALTGSRIVREYTPYGGMMLIFGWLAMML